MASGSGTAKAAAVVPLEPLQTFQGVVVVVVVDSVEVDYSSQ